MLEKLKFFLCKSIGSNVNLKRQGNALLAKGDFDQAKKLYSLYIANHPDDAEGYLNLGFLLIELKEYQEAESYLLKSIYLDAHNYDAHYFLGLAYQNIKNINKSIHCYKLALDINPTMEVAYHQLYQIYSEYPDYNMAKSILIDKANIVPMCGLAQYYVGCIHFHDEQLNSAIDFFYKSLSDESNGELIYFQLGRIYQIQKNIKEAVECYIKALDFNKNNIGACNNLGCIFQEQGRLKEAMNAYRRVIEINPNSAEGYNNIGAILCKENKFKEAILEFEKAIAINPDLFDAHNNIANAFCEMSNYDKAIPHYEKLLLLGGDSAIIINDMAGAFSRQGRSKEAIEQYRKVLSIRCDERTMNIAHSNLLFFQSCSDECTSEEYLAEAEYYGRRVLEKATPYTDWLVNTTAVKHRVLRIGLVSGDFLQHPVGFFIENFLYEIDKTRLQLMVYMTRGKKDKLTERIKSQVMIWRDIEHVNDCDLAEQIREDRIDILIDLSGHTGANRLPLFAWRAAPVQLSWLGYWASTGVPGMDYLLTDRVSVPIEHQADFSEQIWYLPSARMCLTQPSGEEDVTVATLPAIRKKHITFGSFQNTIKLNSKVFSLWAKILKTIPGAKLRLQAREFDHLDMRTRVISRLALAGINSNRVIIEGTQSRKDYFASYNEIDIILDTFPFPGGTTTYEALWMGVPTVTLMGRTMLGRQGASILTYAGLSDWVANTEEEYIAMAINKAGDVNALAALRTGLREQVQASPLFDAVTFARNLENALHKMWEEKIRSANIQG